jgi:hypothetical protein
MKKTKTYARTKFSPETIQDAIHLVSEQAGKEWVRDAHKYYTASAKDADWRYDSEEEFFADYRDAQSAWFSVEQTPHGMCLIWSSPNSTVSVTAPDRRTIEGVFAIFEKGVQAGRIPEPPEPPSPKPVVFIGHGRMDQWKELKDHLHDKHEYEIEAYEVGARAGHAIRGVLERMLGESSFAVLVLTGEDELANGALRARQNVVHEAGLFQGRLGFDRAVLCIEDGVEPFSNVEGIAQIRFPKGHIRETFGEVLATLRREFGARP